MMLEVGPYTAGPNLYPCNGMCGGLVLIDEEWLRRDANARAERAQMTKACQWEYHIKHEDHRHILPIVVNLEGGGWLDDEGWQLYTPPTIGATYLERGTLSELRI